MHELRSAAISQFGTDIHVGTKFTQLGATAFLTLDDGIIRRASKVEVAIKIMNPINWLIERGWNEDGENDVEPN